MVQNVRCVLNDVGPAEAYSVLCTYELQGWCLADVKPSYIRDQASSQGIDKYHLTSNKNRLGILMVILDGSKAMQVLARILSLETAKTE
jgi:hypothetical protein